MPNKSQIIGPNGLDMTDTMTLQYWLDTKWDENIFGVHPLLRKLKEKGQVKTGFGTEFVVKQMVPSAGGPRVEPNADPYNPSIHKRMEGFTDSRWQLAEYKLPVSIPERDTKAQGPQTKKADWEDAVVTQAENLFEMKLLADLWAAESDAESAGSAEQLASIRTLLNGGGGSTTGSAAYPGFPNTHPGQLLAAASSSGAAITKVGGLERNAPGGAYFCPPLIRPGSNDSITKAVINNIISASSKSSGAAKNRGDFLILKETNYNDLLGILQDQQRYLPSKLADYGFEAIQYNGVDVVYEDALSNFVDAAGNTNAFCLNTNAFQLCCGESITPQMRPDVIPGTTTKAWLMVWYGQLIITKFGRGMGSRHTRLVS